MKHLTFYTLLIPLVAMAACMCKPPSGPVDNPFDNDGEAALKVNVTSRADTVRLDWELLSKKEFDTYRIEEKDLGIGLSVPASASGCEIPHFSRYNEAVKCRIALMKGSEAVDELTIHVNIDGLDAEMLAKVMPDHGSVCAGDGMYSVALPDGRSIFLIGDSFVCDVTNGSRPASAHMYRNTYIVYDPATGKASPIYDFRGPGTQSSAAVPPGHPFEDKWYWPLDGFVAGNKLYVFQSLMYMKGEGMWGFAYDSSSLLRYSLPDLKLEKDEPILFKSDKEIHYGAAAFNDGDYIYIYAQVDVTNDMDAKTDVYCARATVDNLYGSWEYWNGKSWTNDSSAAVGLSGLSSVSVSSQFNVFPLKDRYVLLTENKKLWVNEIYTFTSASPTGPWGNKKTIYVVPPFQDSNLMCYNAMAHPQFVKDNMILVSYDMNTSDFAQQAKDVSTYRPRFFWVDIDTILK